MQLIKKLKVTKYKKNNNIERVRNYCRFEEKFKKWFKKTVQWNVDTK